MTDPEEMKAKFREALDKKKQRHHATAEGAEHDGSEKSHGATKPIEQPEFELVDARAERITFGAQRAVLGHEAS